MAENYEERDDERQRARYTSMLWYSNGIHSTHIGGPQQPAANLSMVSQHTKPLRLKTHAFSTTTPDNRRHEVRHPSPDCNENGNNANENKPTTTRSRGKGAVQEGAQSLKSIFQKYGTTFVGTYFSVYLITLSTIFAGLDSGYIDPTTLSNIQFTFPWHSGTGAEEVADAEADAREFRSSVEYIVSKMREFEWTKPYAELVENNKRLGNVAIAWVATKFTEPIRLPLTVMIVPRVAKLLGQKTHDDNDEKDKDDRGDGSATRLK